MRVTVDGNERGTIAGTIVYLRRLRQGANLHRALYEHRQATHDLHEVGLVLWTASGRARDDILEASASVEARGAWLHVETLDVDGELAAFFTAKDEAFMLLRTVSRLREMCDMGTSRAEQ